MTLILTGAAIKIAFWYIEREDEHEAHGRYDREGWKQLWAKGVERFKTPERRKHALALDEESQKKDE